TSVAFPAIFGSDSADVGSAPYAHTYSWDETAVAGAAKSVTVTNGAGLTSTDTFTVTPDTQGPTGGSIAYADGYRTSESVALTLFKGDDDLAGIGSGVLERSSAPLSAGDCGSFGAFTMIAAEPPFGTSDATAASGNCYRYRYVVSDEVG